MLYHCHQRFNVHCLLSKFEIHNKRCFSRSRWPLRNIIKVLNLRSNDHLYSQSFSPFFFLSFFFFTRSCLFFKEESLSRDSEISCRSGRTPSLFPRLFIPPLRKLWIISIFIFFFSLSLFLFLSPRASNPVNFRTDFRD